MRKIKLLISYDGTDFSGWQLQPDKPTIAQALQRAFARVFHKEVSVVGASRTDAGVHAYGQVARIHTDVVVDLHTMQRAWSGALPPSIVIRSIEDAPDSFHPFHNVFAKTYHYQIFTKQPLPFIERYGYYVPREIDIDRFQQVLAFFVGTHNFRAFSTGDPIGDDAVCTIYDIRVEHDPQMGTIKIIVVGDRFLRHMVRRLVGAALCVATRKEVSLALAAETLNSQNPNNILPTAPAKGLLLHDIKYEQEAL